MTQASKKTRIIQFRVDSREYNLLENQMQADGYSNMSKFIRDKCIDNSFATLIILRQINETVKKIDERTERQMG